jgi:interferon-induced GTP-binding protein Mx1
MEKSDAFKANIRIKWRDPNSVYAEGNDWKPVTLNSLEGIEGHISSAQAAILKQGNREVASDVVEVDVYGPDCLSLTLVDLPGIVRSVGKNESKSIVEDIKTLIEGYLTNERCMILAVQPANVDFHNSQILADAKVVDPETRRTIPVITKPDMIDKGAEGSVLQLLLGNRMDDFEMGFHMVKRPGQQALNKGMSMAAAMAAEEKFFTTVAPWKDEKRRDLFGVVALRIKLAELQVRIIQASIPSIVEEITQKRKANEKLLESLGAVITTDLERRYHFSQVVKNVLNDVKATLEGTKLPKAGETKLLNAQNSLFAAFTDDVLSKRFANVGDIQVGRDVIATSATGSELPGKVTYVGVSSLTIIHRGSAQSTSYNLSDVVVDPAWLKVRIKENPTGDLPCFLNPQVFNAIVEEMICEDWAPLCAKLHEDLRVLYNQALVSAAKEHLSSRYPALRGYVRSALEDVIAKEFETAASEFTQVMSREGSSPFTVNHYLFENISKMRSQRVRAKLLNMVDGKTTGIKAIVAAAFDSVERMSMEDHISYEMQVTLDAYGKLAAKRVMDVIPMIILEKAKLIAGKLEQALQVTDARLRKLMVEDTRSLHSQKVAMAEKAKLDVAFKALQGLQVHGSFYEDVENDAELGKGKGLKAIADDEEEDGSKGKESAPACVIAV